MNIIKFLSQNWAASAVCAFLIGAVVLLQSEVNDLKAKLATVGSRDAATAAQMEKFEKDLFARWNAEQIAKSNAIARSQAQQNAAMKAELQNLPMGHFQQNVPFPTATPHE